MTKIITGFTQNINKEWGTEKVMMNQPDTCLKTPLFNEHLALKARMVPFEGWEMPVQYEGILAEYRQTRKVASLFDTCHMGEFIVEGDYRESGLDEIVTISLADMPVKSCRYGFILNDRGGVIDDLIVFREDTEKWFIVINAGTKDKDADHFRQHLKKCATFKDISDQTGKIDIQGPLSRKVLSVCIENIEKLNYYTFDYFDFLGENVIISRTGYTGELGYEIYSPWPATEKIWKKLCDQVSVKPAGLGARDVLRLEMGYSLYGHELSEDISPLEAGLKRFVDFDKDFLGKDALGHQQQEGLKKKIIGFVAETRSSPRAHHKIYSRDKKEIGEVASGTFSPSLEKGIGLGFVAREFARLDEKIFFGDEKRQNAATITKRTFFDKGSLKS